LEEIHNNIHVGWLCEVTGARKLTKPALDRRI
jgi:hypothetical protein